jgi:hypothetical protein
VQNKLMEYILNFLLILFFGYFFIRMFLSANRSIRDWSERNEITIVEKQLMLFQLGPFDKAWNQPIYKLLVQNQQGEQKTVWVRCGTGWWNADKLEVKFNEK